MAERCNETVTQPKYSILEAALLALHVSFVWLSILMEVIRIWLTGLQTFRLGDLGDHANINLGIGINKFRQSLALVTSVFRVLE